MHVLHNGLENTQRASPLHNTLFLYFIQLAPMHTVFYFPFSAGLILLAAFLALERQSLTRLLGLAFMHDHLVFCTFKVCRA